MCYSSLWKHSFHKDRDDVSVFCSHLKTDVYLNYTYVRIHYVAENTLHVHCKDQSVIAVYGNSRGLSWHLRPIHTYHAVPMPLPCCYPAVPLPCGSAKALDCVFPIWFTLCGRVWFTHVMPFPYHATNVPFCKRPLKAMTGSWQGGDGRVMAYWRHVRDLPAYGLCCYHAQFQEVCYQKHTNLRLQWPVWMARSWQVDGMGTAGEQHGNGMVCVNRPLYALYEYTLRQNSEVVDVNTIQPLRGCINLRQFDSIKWYTTHHHSHPYIGSAAGHEGIWGCPW
jgi:hypothetical protein